MGENKVYLALDGLRRRMTEQGLLHVQYPGGRTEFVAFKFFDPAPQAAIARFFGEHQWAIPPEYEQFLELHNGAVLFTDPKGRGGGVEIFGIEQMKHIREAYDYMFTERRYPVAMLNTAMILIDSEAYREGKPYLFWQDCINSPEYAIDLKMDFATWLEYLIIAQGQEYWFWPTMIPQYDKGMQ